MLAIISFFERENRMKVRNDGFERFSTDGIFRTVIHHKERQKKLLFLLTKSCFLGSFFATDEHGVTWKPPPAPPKEGSAYRVYATDEYGVERKAARSDLQSGRQEYQDL